MNVETIAEYKISSNTHKLASQLLTDSFPDYPTGRSCYKLLPQFRCFTWIEDELVAQVGIEHRGITNKSIPVRIFGLIDLCVASAHQRKGIATRLLQQIETLGKAYEMDFLLLFADDARLYNRNGYQRVDNCCRWMKVDEHRTLGMAEEQLADCMMVKPIGKKEWQNGTVDLLGYLF